MLFSDRVREGDWDEALALIEEQGPGLWVDLLAAWVEYGAGDIAKGIDRLRTRQAVPADSFDQRSRLQHVAYHLGLLELARRNGVRRNTNAGSGDGLRRSGISGGSGAGCAAGAPEAEALYLAALRDHPERAIYESLLLGDAEPRLVQGPVDGVAEALLSIAEMTRWVSGRSGSRVHCKSRPRSGRAIRKSPTPWRLDLRGSDSTERQFPRFAQRVRPRGRSGSRKRRHCLEGGDVEGAVSVYNELLDEDPQEPWLSYSLAELYQRSEDYEAARKWYSATLNSYESVLDSLGEIGLPTALGNLSLDEWALSGRSSSLLMTRISSIPDQLGRGTARVRPIGGGSPAHGEFALARVFRPRNCERAPG